MPIVVAGDVFDRWDTPVEFVNFVIGHLPRTTILAVPGQHDLPHHRYDDIKRSAYWTLVESLRVTNLDIDDLWFGNGFTAWGFPWGTPPKPRELPGLGDEDPDYGVCLAVAHRYLWTAGHSFPDAPQDCSVDATASLLAGYDAAVFGDNHTAFLWESGRHKPAVRSILNHGAFIRRRADERHLAPAAGILWSDGTITTVPLDTSGDKWAAVPVPDGLERAGADVAELTRLLERAADAPVSFRETCLRWLETNNPPPAVAAMVRTWLEAKP